MLLPTFPAVLEWSKNAVLAILGSDGKVTLWQAEKGPRILANADGGRSAIFGGDIWMAWSLSGEYLALRYDDPKSIASDTGRMPEKIEIWSANGSLVRIIPSSEIAAVEMAWSPQGDMLAVADLSGKITLVTPLIK